MLTSVSSSSNAATLVVMQGHGIGGYIRAQREARGWTQIDLAARARVNRAHLSQVEIGRIALPSADMRRKIAAALGVRHVDLLIAAGELTDDEIPQAGAAPDAFPHDATKGQIVEQLATLNASEAANVSAYIEFTLGLRARTTSNVRT
jgi:transcriptional regulator with XRE-family HTH domain